MTYLIIWIHERDRKATVFSSDNAVSDEEAWELIKDRDSAELVNLMLEHYGQRYDFISYCYYETKAVRIIKAPKEKLNEE